MSGGGGGGSNFLDMGVMIGASVLAPELAPELFTIGEGGMSLGAASAITGAGLGGVGTALVGGNPITGALGSAIGGYGVGSAGGIGSLLGGGDAAATSGLTTAPGGGITAAAPQAVGPQVAGDIGAAEAADAAGYSGATNGFLNQVPSAVTPGVGNIGAAEAADAAGYGGSTNGVLNQVPGTAPYSVAPSSAGAGPAVNPAGNWLTRNAGLATAGGLGAAYLLQQDAKHYGIPASATTPYTGGNLAKFKYDPNQYTPDVVQPPRPPYQANYAGYARPLGYAGGGLMDPNSEPVDFMGGDMYPQSQIQRSYYATPTQMPTSAQQSAASYEPKTNPLTGEPTANMATGGVASAYSDLMGSRDAIQKYISQYQQDPKSVAAKAQAGDYNAMIALNQIKKTPGQNYAGGGLSSLGGYSDGGRMLKGPGDGMSDSIPASINGKRPARLADGEFVVPADVVSHIGNGSTDAGAKKLYNMMNKVRKARTGKAKQAPAINSSKYIPA